MLTRRQFIQSSALVAFAPVVPAFLPRLAWAAEPQKDSRILVVIQMDGGNDGLNTVVPYQSDAYAKARPTLKLGRDYVLRLSERMALNPTMRAAADLVDDGRLAIIQGVGYPNPNRSHFESMAIWQTARFTAEQQQGSGWIGAALDEVARPAGGGPDSIYVGDEETPRTLLGRRSLAMSLARTDDLTMRLPLKGDRSIPRPSGDDVASFVRRRVLDAVGSATDLSRAMKKRDAGASYPQTELATQLSLVSKLIKAGGGTRVYYVRQGGYDTHGGQAPQQGNLLKQLSEAMKAFLDDMRSARLDDRVLMLCFSEFGRRVQENASQGTDHGTAAPVFIAGSNVQAGLHGEAPDLEHLVDGDLKTTLDFRQVYATLLTTWLNVPAKDALDGSFNPLPLLRAV
jgi:uncharacterized protein (DUF1501 family)